MCAVCYSVLQCVVDCCRLLQIVVDCCSVLQCVVVCSSVPQCTAAMSYGAHHYFMTDSAENAPPPPKSTESTDPNSSVPIQIKSKTQSEFVYIKLPRNQDFFMQ